MRSGRVLAPFENRTEGKIGLAETEQGRLRDYKPLESAAACTAMMQWTAMSTRPVFNKDGKRLNQTALQ